jgi:RNA polymerase sigma-70 factor, ECF subfamily
MGYLRSVSPSLAFPEPGSSCLETFERELDYLFQTLQRFGARPAEIEDLLQDVFVALHRSWPTLDTTRSLRPWLFGVAFRTLYKHRRRRARETPVGGLDLEDGARTPEGWLESKQSLALLSAALECVPAARRSVLVMHNLEGLAVADIARKLSITKFGVYARLYKGHKELASAVRRLRKEAVRK